MSRDEKGRLRHGLPDRQTPRMEKKREVKGVGGSVDTKCHLFARQEGKRTN